MTFDVQATIQLTTYLGAGLCIGLGAIGAALGEGYAAGLANVALSQRPEKSGEILKNMLVGQAVAESAAIFALVIAILLIFMDIPNPSLLKAAALGGAGICRGFGASGAGVGSGFPGGEVCLGMARQPAVTSRLTTNMLIGSAVCQTPAIFSMVVALLLMFKDFGNLPFSPTWAALIGAGLSTGLAAIGSGAGGGMAAGSSCESIARQPETFSQVTTTMLVAQAVSQTPAIFGLLISFILMFKAYPEASTLSAPVALLAAGICMGLGGIGPGIGNGLTAREAVKAVGRNMEATGVITRTMLVAQAIAQSKAVYSMIVCLVLLTR